MRCPSLRSARASVTLTIRDLPDLGRQHVDHLVHGREGTNRWGLWRYPGSSCSGTGKRYADYLTALSIFIYTAQTVDKLAFLNVRLPINIKPSEPRFLDILEDDIVLRNSTRS